MFPFRTGPLMGGGVSAEVLTFVGASLAAAETTVTSVSMPVGSASGDIGLFFDMALDIGGTAPSSVTPSGWTALGSSLTGTDGAETARFNIWRRILNGTETTLAGMQGEEVMKGVIVLRKDQGTWDTPVLGAARMEVDPSDISVAVSAITKPLVVIGFGAGFGFNVNNLLAMSPVGTYSDGPLNQSVTIGHIIYNTSPVNNTVSQTQGELQALAGLYVSAS